MPRTRMDSNCTVTMPDHLKRALHLYADMHFTTSSQIIRNLLNEFAEKTPEFKALIAASQDQPPVEMIPTQEVAAPA